MEPQLYDAAVTGLGVYPPSNFKIKYYADASAELGK